MKRILLASSMLALAYAAPAHADALSDVRALNAANDRQCQMDWPQSQWAGAVQAMNAMARSDLRVNRILAVAADRTMPGQATVCDLTIEFADGKIGHLKQ